MNIGYAFLLVVLFTLFLVGPRYLLNILFSIGRKEDLARTAEVRQLLNDIKAIAADGETRAARATIILRTPFGNTEPVTTYWMTQSRLEQKLQLARLDSWMNGSTMSATIEESNTSDLLKQAIKLARGLPIATEVALLKEDLNGDNNIPAGPLVHTTALA